MRSCRVGEAPDVDFELVGEGKEETLVVLESVRTGFREEEESVGEDRAEVEDTDDEGDEPSSSGDDAVAAITEVAAPPTAEFSVDEAITSLDVVEVDERGSGGAAPETLW